MQGKNMFFIEGTIFYTRPILFLFSKYGYVPIGKSKEIINDLFDKGNEIYLVSYVKNKRYDFIQSVIETY